MPLVCFLNFTLPIYRRYTTEVKRIEELLAMRERERTELLNQYKHLNDEVETSVNYGRQLESRVSSFSIYLIQFKKNVLGRVQLPLMCH